MSLGSLIPWRAVRHAALWSDADRLFDELWNGFDLVPSTFVERVPRFVPHINVAETDEGYRLTAELPGLEEKDFEVVLEDDVLTIKGEKRTQHEEKREGYRHVESASGSFRRAIPLPNEVDGDAVKATYKQGVVTVVLPKLAEARRHARTVPIETS